MLWLAAAALALVCVAALAFAVLRQRPGAWASAAAIAVLVPAIAFGIYWLTGEPDYPDQPFAMRIAAPPSNDPAHAAMPKAVDRLTERLEAGQGDARGWMLLGRSLTVLQRNLEAAKAFARARELEPDRPEIALALGQAMVLAQHGVVSDDALTAFTQVIEAEPDNANALYFLGLGWAQRGEYAAAIDRWKKLLGLAPADSPWIADVKRRMAKAAEAGGIDLDAPGPTAEDVDAAGKMSPEERAQMIRGMVERLAARLQKTPDDLAGWKRLARAYRVLGETDKADAADAHVRALEKN